MMRRFHEASAAGAPSVTVWGTGSARREFLHVDDLADALVLVMRRGEELGPINIGSSEEITIGELSRMIRDVVGFSGKIEFDPTKPEGAPRRVVDSSRIRGFGWKPRIGLREGLTSMYRCSRENGAL
jgi:GDP-L-fucose synthase